MLEDGRVPDRIALRVSTDGPTPTAPYRQVDGPCWIWTGSYSSPGYGQAWDGSRTRPAHSLIYELLVGPIPDGMELDHLCRVRACVNPDHIEPVTHAENMRRSTEARTHCIHGHEFTPENTAHKKATGARECLICRRQNNLRSHARRAERMDED